MEFREEALYGLLPGESIGGDDSPGNNATPTKKTGNLIRVKQEIVHIIKGVKVDNIRPCFNDHGPVRVAATMDPYECIGPVSEVINDLFEEVDNLRPFNGRKGGTETGKGRFIQKNDRLFP